ncbi:MAG: hypothetical protein Kow0062_26670 [Acidobacteriota bacterium]
MQQNPLIKEYLDIAFRRKWWIVVPTLLGMLFSTALYFRVEKLYMAETRVRTSPQEISERLLQPIVESDAQQLVTSITAEITSEEYVQEVDEELHLVGSPGGPRDLTELARWLDRAIRLEPNPRNQFFDLKVSWNDPKLAAAIANKLAQIYIDRYSEIRHELASGTLDQLRQHRQEVEDRLREVRERIEKFRSEHKYELASYQDENRLQFDNNMREIERLAQLNRDLRGQIEDIDLRLRAGLPAAGGGGAAIDPRLARLESLRTQYNERRAQGLKDDHPEVQALLDQIRALEREIGVPSGEEGAAEPGLSPAALDRIQLERQKQRLLEEIRINEGKIAALQAENEVIRRRQERTPDNQIQLDNMLQLEAQLQQEYDDARSRELRAQTGEMVEELGRGEKFDVLKYARPPGEPYWPDFKLFLLMGLAVGLGLGVSVVLLLEVFDQSFKSEEQLAAAIDLPILAVIPDLNRVADQKTRRRTARDRRAS